MFKGIKKVIQPKNNYPNYIVQIFFKGSKKPEKASVAEEIKITNLRNFYNDSLANEPEYDEEEEEEEEEKKDQQEDKDKVIKIEEIIEVQKKDNTSKENIKSPKENVIKIEEKDDNNNNKNDPDPDDKTASCHYITFDGEDIDITNKRAVNCLEQNNNIVLLKKFSKSKRYLFLEEQFLYVAKDLKQNKENININSNIKRVVKKYDIGRLCEMDVKEENHKYIFKLQFLRNDYFDKNIKIFIFETSDGNDFYEQLSDSLEKVESTFFYDNSDDENEGEEEEDDNNEVVDDSMNDVDMSNRQMNSINFRHGDNDLISSSRKKIA